MFNFLYKKICRYVKEIDKGTYLLLLGMLYATIFFCSFVMGYKTIDFYGRILCSSVFVFPLLFPLNDSITELLGKKTSYLMIAAIIICEFIFSIVTYTLSGFPSPPAWKNQDLYPILTTGFIHIAIADSISLAIGFFINTHVLDRWGVKLFGRSFFMRSLGCTAIGELFFTISTNIIAFHSLSTASISDTANIIFSDYFLKMVYSFIICVPNALIVRKIKTLIPNENYDSEHGNVISIKKMSVNYRI